VSRAGLLGPLRRLARLHGVQAAYRDAAGERRVAAADTLLGVLAALGVTDLARPEDAGPALGELLRERCRRLLEPVTAVWSGAPAEAALRVPDNARGEVALSLRLEEGGGVDWSIPVADLPGSVTDVTGERVRISRLELPEPLPPGYHQLTAWAGGHEAESLLIAAPVRAYGSEEGARRWGGFLPLHALRTADAGGVGDLRQLRQLAEWIGGLGGDLLGTLPLLPAYLGERPHDPSPYSPVSRLFWNELYLDLHDAARLAGARSGADLLNAPEFGREARTLRRAPLVDYRREAVRRRGALDRIAAEFFEQGGADRPDYRAFLAESGEAEVYARFRAAVEQAGAGWHAWPVPMQRGRLRAGEYDPAAARAHLFAQFALESQLAGLREGTAARLYLDMPLGVHPEGFDAWRHRDLFAPGMNVGAPPDPFFAAGQDWGFPPILPEASRRTGHAYLIGVLRHHCRHAGMLRLDHVMALYRLFWVPHGAGARHGVYVRYPVDELFAIVALESHRHRCAIVGEDLGTVPAAVRARMQRHGVHRMAVAQFDARPDPAAALPQAPVDSVASLNTHDMPPFAAFWRGSDIRLWQGWGWLDEDQARQRARERARLTGAILSFLRTRCGFTGRATPRAVTAAVLARLASGPARFLLVNLEDLCQETAPQNVPGTTDEWPNWRRKARSSLEDMRRSAQVVDVLRDIDQRRRSHD
jgi:4-alpha-glucanotransferase